MACVENAVAAISAADMKVILVICFSIWCRSQGNARLPVVKSDQPGQIFHHARSTKRELLRTLRGTRQSHPHASVSRLSNGDGVAASRRRQRLLFRVHRLRFGLRRIACFANSVGRLHRTRKVAEFCEATAMTSAVRDVAQRGRRPRRRCPAGGRSHPVMAVAMMTRECIGRKIIRAVAVAAVRDAAAGRRTRTLQHGPVGRIPGSRRWPASIQNVQIGIIERERARLLDGGLRECRRRCHRGQQHGRCKSFE
jgi:hypothetical protein